MKINKCPKFKPITCYFCKCVYEHEMGDKIYIGSAYNFNNEFHFVAHMDCPICGYKNELDFDDERGKNEF